LIPLIHHPDYTFELPAKHPFPMAKFQVLRAQLDTLSPQVEWITAPLAKRTDLARIHTESYLDALLAGTLDAAAERRSGFKWSEALIKRVRLETGGTLSAAEQALVHGLALNTAGGTHHAHADAASGYCLLNDLAVTAAALLANKRVNRVLIIDLDVHQGDGTARLFADEPRVFTFSMHAARNFPTRKATSDLDVELTAGLNDSAYLAQLQHWLPVAIERAQPDLVLYDAGVDVHRDDRLGLLSLSNAGLAARDSFVLKQVRSQGIALAGVIGGGYDRDIEALCLRHRCLFEQALSLSQ
jgi:acetoin utilization deacetylase AcuC-like enzyme